MCSRDRLEMLDALELSLKGLLKPKVFAGDYLDRTMSTGDAKRHPDLTVGTAPDLPHQLIVRNRRRKERLFK